MKTKAIILRLFTLFSQSEIVLYFGDENNNFVYSEIMLKRGSYAEKEFLVMLNRENLLGTWIRDDERISKIVYIFTKFPLLYSIEDFMKGIKQPITLDKIVSTLDVLFLANMIYYLWRE